MLVDKSGNQICIKAVDNPNMEVLGRCGSGKTYGCNRYLEDSVRNGIPALIVDFSGSYTETELAKANFDHSVPLRISNFYECSGVLYAGTTIEKVIDNVSDSLIAVLEVSAMTQKKILQEERYQGKTFHIN